MTTIKVPFEDKQGIGEKPAIYAKYLKRAI